MVPGEELISVPIKLVFNVTSLEKYLKVRLPDFFKVSTDSPQITVKFFRYLLSRYIGREIKHIYFNIQAWTV